MFKSRIKNKYIESWHSDVRKETKFRTYVLHLKMSLMLKHIY